MVRRPCHTLSVPALPKSFASPPRVYTAADLKELLSSASCWSFITGHRNHRLLFVVVNPTTERVPGTGGLLRVNSRMPVLHP